MAKKPSVLDIIHDVTQQAHQVTKAVKAVTNAAVATSGAVHNIYPNAPAIGGVPGPSAGASVSAAASTVSPQAAAAARQQEKVIQKYVFNRERRRAVYDAVEKDKEGNLVLTKSPREIGETVREATSRIKRDSHELLTDPRIQRINSQGKVLKTKQIRKVEKTRAYESTFSPEVRREERNSATGPYLGESRTLRRQTKRRQEKYGESGLGWFFTCRTKRNLGPKKILRFQRRGFKPGYSRSLIRPRAAPGFAPWMSTHGTRRKCRLILTSASCCCPVFPSGKHPPLCVE